MSRSLYGWIVFVFLGVSFSTNLDAQDIHFSQFYYSPFNQNPSLIGVFAGDQRFIGNYRSQWNKVPVGYQTFSGSYDQRIQVKGVENSLIGLGGIMNYDKAGDSKLQMINIGLGGSITHQMGENHFLSAGLLATVTQRSFDFAGLSFNHQFVDGFFGSSNSTGEETFAKLNSRLFFDASLGINWHYQVPSKRRRLDLGAALLHLNQPKVNFYENEETRLAARWNGFANFSTQIAEKFDLLVRGSFQLQKKYNENLIGLGVKYYANQGQYNELGIQLGVSMRFNKIADAIAPGFELHYQKWILGFTYDINLSDFDLATNGRGGPELAIIHKIFRVKDLKEIRNCPIY